MVLRLIVNFLYSFIVILLDKVCHFELLSLRLLFLWYLSFVE